MPQVGWYQDPDNDKFMRWWNGSNWTEKRQPLPPTSDAFISADTSLGHHGEYRPSIPVGYEDEYVDSHDDANNGASRGMAVRSSQHGIGNHNLSAIGKPVRSIVFAVFWLTISTFIFSAAGFFGAGEDELSTEGTVISAPVETWTDSDGDQRRGCSPSGTAVIDGHEYDFSGGMRVSPCPWDAGDDVTVIYHPDNPADTIRVDSREAGFIAVLFPLIFFGAGLLVLGSGIWGLIKGVRQRKQVN